MQRLLQDFLLNRITGRVLYMAGKPAQVLKSSFPFFIEDIGALCQTVRHQD